MPLIYALYYSLVPQQHMGEIVGLNQLSLYNYEMLFREYPIMTWMKNSLITMGAVVASNLCLRNGSQVVWRAAKTATHLLNY
ncbi:hypothetical protein LJC33_08675 [Eubacteriales bacterium OttesenSCG-928-N13]|nr:hypothetical protein [Eubacteriales bacterium OttesenSCG-928-N13]